MERLLYKIFKFRHLIFTLAFFCLILLAWLVIYNSLPPANYPDNEIVTLKSGSSLSQAADTLAANNIIRSPLLFKLYVIISSGHRQVQAGDYLFDTPQSALKVASRAANGIQGLPKIRITIAEGMTTKDISNILTNNIPHFDTKTFLALATSHEGSLFPDTYYFYENTTPAQIVDQLLATFNMKTKPLLLEMKRLGRPMPDILAMASIVEREATSSVDRRIIAGILWKRIDLHMPLQVDPPFYYILGKDSAHLTRADLAMDSPYNLYKHTGLPPTPIGNPGFDAIEDTITPTATKYLYYLSGSDGRMHYAETFDQHLANSRKYIR